MLVARLKYTIPWYVLPLRATYFSISRYGNRGLHAYDATTKLTFPIGKFLGFLMQ